MHFQRSVGEKAESSPRNRQARFRKGPPLLNQFVIYLWRAYAGSKYQQRGRCQWNEFAPGNPATTLIDTSGFNYRVLSNIGEFSPNKKTLYDFTPLAGMKSFLFHGAEQVSVRVMPGIGSRSAVNLTGRSPAQHRSAARSCFPPITYVSHYYPSHAARKN